MSQTSLQDLGDIIGVTRNALYYHFEDREDLFFHTYIRSCEILSDHIADAVRAHGNSLETLKAFVSAALNPASPEPASLNEHGLLDEARYNLLNAKFDAVVRDLANVVQRGVAVNELRPCDEETVARTIISIIYSIPLWSPGYIAQAGRRQRIIEAFCDLLERGWSTDRNQQVHPPMIDLSPLIVTANGFDRTSLDNRRRETILSVASQMFNKRGVGATKLEHIAEILGTSKQQLYRYFTSKHDLVAACFKRTRHIYGYIISEAVASGGSPSDRLLGVMRTSAMVQQHEELQTLHYATAIGSLSKQDQEQARKWRREHALEYTRLFEEGQRRNEIRVMDLRVLAFVVSGANHWIGKCAAKGQERRKAQIAVEVYELLRVGLLPLN